MSLDLLLDATGVPDPMPVLDVVEEPMPYTDFVRELGVELTAGQYVFCRVAYDGAEPRDLSDDERAIARVLFGPLDVIAPAARDVIVAVAGGRAGKTYILEALRLLHLALTVSLRTLAPGEVASAPIIAPSLDLARQPLNYIKGACRHSDILPLVEKPSQLEPSSESVTLRREDGHLVEIVCRAASARGSTGRGRTLVGAVMDECAFFFDATYKVNDEEIFKAVRPRVVRGGQTILASTPWAQSGLLYDLFVANHAEPSRAGLTMPARCDGTALAAHAPSLVLRDHDDLRVVVEAETKRDPENALREYGAHFMSAGAETFFDAATLTVTIDYEALFVTLPEPGTIVTCGADLAFATNSSALAIWHHTEGRVSLGELVEMKAEPGSPLKPSDVFAHFAERMKAHGARVVMSDAHYRQTFVEFLAGEGIGFLDAPTVPSEAYVRARVLMQEGRVRIPNHERLVRQLREVTGKKLAGGGVQILKPRWRSGEHGDLADAAVLGLFQVSGEVVRAPAPAWGSPAYWAAENEKRLKERRKQVGAKPEPFWKRGLRR